jgi:hypothetical protein
LLPFVLLLLPFAPLLLLLILFVLLLPLKEITNFQKVQLNQNVYID